MLFFIRINPWEIIKGHFSTFYDDNDHNKKVSILELTIILLITVFVPLLLYFNCVEITKQLMATLLNAYAIIGGFLFSALFVFVSHYDKLKDDIEKIENDDEHSPDIMRKKNILEVNKELFNNLSFGVFLSFINVTICVIFFFNPAKLTIVSYICIGLLILFIHTLMMILKRMYFIFSDNLS